VYGFLLLNAAVVISNPNWEVDYKFFYVVQHCVAKGRDTSPTCPVSSLSTTFTRSDNGSGTDLIPIPTYMKLNTTGFIKN
jgi:hypothetical protein